MPCYGWQTEALRDYTTHWKVQRMAGAQLETEVRLSKWQTTDLARRHCTFLPICLIRQMHNVITEAQHNVWLHHRFQKRHHRFLISLLPNCSQKHSSWAWFLCKSYFLVTIGYQSKNSITAQQCTVVWVILPPPCPKTISHFLHVDISSPGCYFPTLPNGSISYKYPFTRNSNRGHSIKTGIWTDGYYFWGQPKRMRLLRLLLRLLHKR